jgi:hypothetical protein
MTAGKRTKTVLTLAIMKTAWLDDYSLQAPVPK